jgi:hypothetical protein
VQYASIAFTNHADDDALYTAGLPSQRNFRPCRLQQGVLFRGNFKMIQTRQNPTTRRTNTATWKQSFFHGPSDNDNEPAKSARILAVIAADDALPNCRSSFL